MVYHIRSGNRSKLWRVMCVTWWFSVAVCVMAEPLVPQQMGLQFRHVGCGRRDEMVVSDIPPEIDLAARDAWTSDLYTYRGTDPASVMHTAKDLGIAQTMSKAYRAWATEALRSSSDMQYFCRANLLLHSLPGRTGIGHRVIVTDELQTLVDRADTKHRHAIKRAVMAWYADDIVRRLEFGLEFGCEKLVWAVEDRVEMGCVANTLNLTIPFPSFDAPCSCLVT